MHVADPWSRYWRSGQTHSCFSAAGAVDTQAIWTPIFAALPAGARLLDLACGAGAVARMALGAGRGFVVTGVDYATGLTPIEGARLIENTRLEALPFADRCFDAALSQYGFEYADAGAAAAQIARVLAPGGRLALLVHASEGPPVAAARARLARARPLLAAGGLAQLTRRLGQAAAARQPTAALERQIIAAFQAAAALEQDETTQWALGFLAEILNKRGAFPPAYLIDNAATAIDEVSCYCHRLEAMTAAAMTQSGAEARAARFSALGFAMAPVIAARLGDGDLIGWILAGTKP